MALSKPSSDINISFHSNQQSIAENTSLCVALFQLLSYHNE